MKNSKKPKRDRFYVQPLDNARYTAVVDRWLGVGYLFGSSATSVCARWNKNHNLPYSHAFLYHSINYFNIKIK